jgi:hypothetical protein
MTSSKHQYPGTLEVVCDRSMVATLDPMDLLEMFVDLLLAEPPVWCGITPTATGGALVPSVVVARGSRPPNLPELRGFTERWAAWLDDDRSGPEPIK